MKRWLLGLAITMALSVVAATDAPTVETEPLDLEGITRLDVRTENGNITLTVADDAPSVTIRLRGDVTYSLERSRSTLSAAGGKRTRACNDCEVSFEFRVPAGLEVKLSAQNGSLEVEGAVASLEADTRNGNVTAKDLAAQVRVNGNNGAITLERLSLPGDSHSWAKTRNGLVTVTGITADDGLTITGRLTNGQLQLNLPDYHVTSDARSFEARKQGSSPARLELETVNGTISVR